MPVSKIIVAKATARIDEKVDAVSESYTAGEEKSKLTISGEGSATISHVGDGDADLETRVYVDGTLAESIICNQAGVITAGFSTSLEIRVYAAAAVTASCSTCHVAGWRFA